MMSITSLRDIIKGPRATTLKVDDNNGLQEWTSTRNTIENGALPETRHTRDETSSLPLNRVVFELRARKVFFF